MLHVWSARKAILRGNRSAAARELGQALHYIHDKSVQAGSPRAHEYIEKKISSLVFPYNALKSGRKRGVCSYTCAEQCVSRTTPKNDAVGALWEATEHSVMLIRAVFGDVNISDNAMKSMMAYKWLYFVLSLCLGIISLILLPILLISHAGWPSFPSVLLGLVSVVVIAKPLQKYLNLRLECKWFASGSKSQPTLF